MSYRASFTSEYINCYNDYKIIREKANNLSSSKNLCIAPPFFFKRRGDAHYTGQGW